MVAFSDAALGAVNASEAGETEMAEAWPITVTATFAVRPGLSATTSMQPPAPTGLTVTTALSALASATFAQPLTLKGA